MSRVQPAGRDKPSIEQHVDWITDCIRYLEEHDDLGALLDRLHAGVRALCLLHSEVGPAELE